ncbi:MAG TPA: helix-hairpin-helix domain-containing protein [Ignavibacteriaceae bacterium]|nr:helix-hairpin-helix domain-containing protein [Ignavibacteriaceae bacterium]
MLDKLSRKIGFTNTEIKVILFLISVFLTGLGYKAYLVKENSADYTNFDYSSQEKLFKESGEKINPDTASEGNKNVDYKREVLDFNNGNFYKKEAKKLPGIKSININTAGLNDLVKLPGIGDKTAEKIIALREKKGGFKKLNELLEVKGIGETRLNNIEKFLYIDY